MCGAQSLQGGALRATILNSPRELVRLKCEQAGLELQPQLCTNKNGTRKTVWKGLGPMSAYNFCQTNRMKKLGQVCFFFSVAG